MFDVFDLIFTELHKVVSCLQQIDVMGVNLYVVMLCLLITGLLITAFISVVRVGPIFMSRYSLAPSKFETHYRQKQIAAKSSGGRK